ncbi:uncharacterized protein ACOB6Z_009948 [Ctenodactylus gundi]
MDRNRSFSSDFTLTGLFTHSKASGFLFSVICAVFLMALVANGAMILLIHVDPHLHTPMYFLLSHLSFIDMMYVSTIVPKMLVDYLLGQGTISFAACTAQYFLYMGFVGAEFFLLGLMAYDRYVAICHPLRYPVLMSRRVCWLILASSWFGGALDSFLLTPITMSLPFCTSHTINHFFCEAPTMLRLACGDKAAYEMVMYVCCVMMLLLPFSVVMASYTHILITVHQMKSAEGRKKAFATCSSHIFVVTLFYGAALYTYMLPQAYHTPLKDKIFSAFYTILTPLINPLTYSLRNRDVMGALKRALARRRGTCGLSGRHPERRQLCSAKGFASVWGSSPVSTSISMRPVEGHNMSSADFAFVGLFSGDGTAGLLFAVVSVIFFTALLANGTMVLLIHVDPRLHTPMYFLLSHLSLIDTMYISTIVPKMLANHLLGQRTISFVGCTAQHFLYLTLVGAEFFLLGLMAYDRYVAICHPFRYPILMSRRVCWLIVAGSWFGGALDGFLLTPITMSLPFCGSREIQHYFCEAPAVLRLACADTALYETVMYVCCVLMLLVPFSVVTASYARILTAVHRMSSLEGRKKAFATCSSHMLVVTLFYGAAIYTYMLPHAYHTPAQDRVFSVFYTILTPMLNPLIYSLRNKDVAGALSRALGRLRTSRRARRPDTLPEPERCCSPGRALPAFGCFSQLRALVRQFFHARAAAWANYSVYADFVLLGLFQGSRCPWLLFVLILLVFVASIASNTLLIALTRLDPRLDTPMYFLLGQLSLMDILYISTIVPKMLLDQALGRRTISFAGCTAQHFLYLTLAGAEFFLLGLMSYDRYVAICCPLRYPVLMSRRTCLLIVGAAWLGGSVDGFLLTPVTMRFPFCASRRIDHFFCEVPALLKLSCVDTSAYETAMYACCILMLLIPFSVISASYARILLAVRSMKEAEGRRKAAATCSSHMLVVSLFYGAAMYTYVLPHSYHTPAKDKAVSAFYTILTPLLNPLIYSLRNKEVAGALGRVLGRGPASRKVAAF